MKADVWQQHSLLKLAGLDAELTRLAHRSTHLPEQQDYERIEADLARQCFTIRAMDAEGRETFAFDSGQAG